MADNVYPLLRSFGVATVERAQRNLGATRTVRGKKRRAVATDKLRKSLKFTLRTTKKGYSFNFKSLSYGRYVEYGRGPTKNKGGKGELRKNIEKWIENKNIKPRENGKFVKATPARLKGLAFVISRKIHEQGIEPLYFYRDAINDTLEEYGQRIAEELTKKIITDTFK
jgi:hypothetical protein